MKLNDSVLSYIETYGERRPVFLCRKWHLLSGLLHSLFIATVILLQLFILLDEPPVPSNAIIVLVAPPLPVDVPPPPPPPLRAPAASVTPGGVSRVSEDRLTAAPEPTEPPVEVNAEKLAEIVVPDVQVDRSLSTAGDPFGAELGVPGGVAGGVPGGVPDSATPPPPKMPAPVRVSAESRAAIPLVRVNPVYPELAVKSRVEGIVLLDVLVGESGEPEELRVLRSHQLFESAAIDAVEQWRWNPYLFKGVSVPFKVVVTIEFRLTRRRDQDAYAGEKQSSADRGRSYKLSRLNSSAA